MREQGALVFHSAIHWQIDENQKPANEKLVLLKNGSYSSRYSDILRPRNFDGLY